MPYFYFGESFNRLSFTPSGRLFDPSQIRATRHQVPPLLPTATSRGRRPPGGCPDFGGAARGEELGRCRTSLAGGTIMRIVHIGQQEVYLPAKSPIGVHREASSSTVSVWKQQAAPCSQQENSNVDSTCRQKLCGHLGRRNLMPAKDRLVSFFVAHCGRRQVIGPCNLGASQIYLTLFRLQKKFVQTNIISLLWGHLIMGREWKYFKQHL